MAPTAKNEAERDLTLERDQECIPVAMKLIQALAKRDLSKHMGSTLNQQETALFMNKVYLEDVVPIMLESNIKLNQLPFVFSIILQPFQFLNDVTTSNFENNRDIADGFKYGMPDITEMRVSDLDAALREGVQDVKAKAGAKTEALQAKPEKPVKKSAKKSKGGDKS